MAKTYRVRNSDTIREHLNELHVSSMLSWRKIAEMDEFSKIGIPAGTLCSIAKGYPIPKKWREELGLAPEGIIIQMNGNVPPRSQTIGAKMCVVCSRWYISNHPRRQRCFICSPFRGTK